MPSIETDISRFVKDYDRMDANLQTWAQQISRFDDAHSMSTLKVAISRKTPRILSYLKHKFHLDIHAISEIALPFVNPDTYDGAIILDDAIYYGTTFQHIQAATQYILRGKPVMAAPAVMSDHAKPLNLSFGPYECLKPLSIKEEDIPFYINTIIDIIQAGPRPYDIEAPIFFLTLSGDIEQRLNRLVDVISSNRGLKGKLRWYATERYNKKYDRTDTSYSIPLESLFANHAIGAKPDIAKLRFKAHKGKLAISAYCFYPIDERLMVADTPMFPAQVNQLVWNPLIHAVRNLKQSHSPEWDYQVHRSLCVMANYLMSFFLFRALSPYIRNIFEVPLEPAALLDTDDLAWLIGPDLAAPFKEALATADFPILDKVQKAIPVVDNSTAVIPREYQYDYANTWMGAVERQDPKTVEGILTAKFSSMHRVIELPSRDSKSANYRRLQFGESLGSLKLQNLASDIDASRQTIIAQTHQALDSRIDNGSAVPAYVRQESEFNSHCWTRLFRSGENDDPLRDQALRNYLYVLNEIRNNSHYGVSESLFTLSLILLYMCGIRLSNHQLVAGSDEYGYNLSIILPRGIGCDVSECMQQSGIISCDYGRIKMIDSPTLADLSRGNNFTAAEESKIQAVLKEVLDVSTLALAVSRVHNLLNMCLWPAQQYMLKNQLADFVKQAENFVKELGSHVKDSNAAGVSLHVLDKKLRAVLNYIPMEPDLKERKALNDNPVLVHYFSDDKVSRLMADCLPFSRHARNCFFAMVILVARVGLYPGTELPSFLLRNIDTVNYPGNSIRIGNQEITLYDFLNSPDALSQILDLSVQETQSVAYRLLRNK